MKEKNTVLEKEREEEEKNQATSANSCEECKTNPSKYKCPGCSIRTCSLACVNSHKQRTSCTGKRALTEFVAISQFDDNQLLSDYRLLEDVKRMAESAQRKRIRLCGYHSNRLPIHLKALKNAASKRRTKLILLSHGMSKREKNQTYYNHRKKFILWTIEWCFHGAGFSLVEHGVNENSTISSVIQKHLEPGPWNHPLKKFGDYGFESLTFCIQKHPKLGSKSPLLQLDINKPIRQQLADAVILEYPIIFVFAPSHKHNFEVISIKIPEKIDVKEPPRQDSPSPKGLTFTVEVIKEEAFSDPKPLSPVGDVKTEAKKESIGLEGTDNATMIEDSSFCQFFTLDQLSDIPEFDFEPSSSLEIFPGEDDFFGFDGGISSGDHGGRVLPVDEEELEEGEIA